MSTHPPGLAAAVDLMLTPPPLIGEGQAAQSAATHYGWPVTCKPLAGERDRNFFLQRNGQSSVALKFINASETPEETDLQVCGLTHLSELQLSIATPRPLKTLLGDCCFSVDTPNGLVRGRAYTFLEGQSAVVAAGSPALRHSVGRAVGTLDEALRTFRHRAMSRVFLWDLMHVAQLSAFADHVRDEETRTFVLEFLDCFSRLIKPELTELPCQFIHADLSKSNLLVSSDGLDRVTGILDFGDMVYAPRVADLAIAASYQMSDAQDPMEALAQVVEGFLSVCTMEAREHRHVLDLVMARLVQRVVITAWRASHFPENKDYILRSNPDAQRLIAALIPIWRSDFQRRHPQAKQ